MSSGKYNIIWIAKFYSVEYSAHPKKSRIATIIFGELGDYATLSLCSMSNLMTGDSGILCVLGDDVGLRQISRIHEHKSLKFELCIHHIEQNLLETLGLKNLNQQSKIKFGDAEFFKLTTFKWRLLLDILNSHKEAAYVLFTDLDILWFQSIDFPRLFGQYPSSTIVLAQDDTPSNSSTTYFCGGIIVLKSSAKAKKILSKLYEYQLHENLQNRLIHDEKTLNMWYRNQDKGNALFPLDKDAFVIGHRYLSFATKRKIKYKSSFAFHANYVVKSKHKYNMLLSIELQKNGNPRWFFYFMLNVAARIRRSLAPYLK